MRTLVYVAIVLSPAADRCTESGCENTRKGPNNFAARAEESGTARSAVYARTAYAAHAPRQGGASLSLHHVVVSPAATATLGMGGLLMACRRQILCDQDRTSNTLRLCGKCAAPLRISYRPRKRASVMRICRAFPVGLPHLRSLHRQEAPARGRPRRSGSAHLPRACRRADGPGFLDGS